MGAPASTDRSSLLTGAALVAVSALLFGIKGVLVKLAYPYGLDATGLLGLRMAIALPCFLAVAWWTSRPPAPPLSGRDLMLCAGLGVLGYQAASWLDFAGLERIDVATERVVLYLYPTVVVLVGVLIGQTRLTRAVLAALALTYAGILVTCLESGPARGAAAWGGIALVAASGIAYALFLVGSGAPSKRLGGVRFMAVAMCAAALGVVAQALATRPLAMWDQPAPVWLLGVALAIPGTVLPSLLAGAGLSRVGPARSAIIGTVGPVATVLMAWAVLGERPGSLVWAGGALTVVGGTLIGLAKPGRA